MNRNVAAALAVALTLGVASCGGSEETLTRAELVRQVNVACRDGQELSQRQMRATRGAAARDGTGFLTAILDGQRTVVDRLDDLNPPDAAKDDFDAFKQGVQDRLDLFARVESVGSRGLQRAMAAAQRDGEVLTRSVQDAATRLGVRGCI